MGQARPTGFPFTRERPRLYRAASWRRILPSGMLWFICIVFAFGVLPFVIRELT